MKNKNYRLTIKEIDGSPSFFIEEKVKYFFGLLSYWDILELGNNFKSAEEAKRFLKQLEVKRAKFHDKIYYSNTYYYDFHTDKIVDQNGDSTN